MIFNFQQEVHHYFTSQNCKKKLGGQKLKILNENFRIMPDDQFIFNDRIILFEYEKNKRFVESISKYWWLYKKTKFAEYNQFVFLFLIICLEKPDSIRLETCELLGKMLENEFNTFRFNLITYNNCDLRAILDKSLIG